jgi:hypothetical protein
MAEIQIYTPNPGPRLKYIAHFIFREVLGAARVEIISQPQFTAPVRINYSDTALEGTFQITPFGLLSEKGLRLQPLHAMEYEGISIFFPVAGGNLPFDFFSAAFFLLSRYEEYLPGLRDEHNRFAAAYSTASHLGFLQLPYIDLWAGKLAARLSEFFHTPLTFNNKYSAALSIDVDFPYAFKGHNTRGQTLRLMKDVAKMNSEASGARIKFMKKGKDPFDTFDALCDAAKAARLPIAFFCQTGDQGPYDRNLHPKNPVYASLLRKLAKEHQVGLHPSYKSADEPHRLLEEKERLETALSQKIHTTRQHYIRIKTPEYYRKLIEINITHDYSMGYVRQPGFRASTSRSFKFYDVEKDLETPLTIHPFVLMDSIFVNHLLVGETKALQLSKAIIAEVKRTQGVAHIVFHNPVLSETFEWKGWSGYFYKVLESL